MYYLFLIILFTNLITIVTRIFIFRSFKQKLEETSSLTKNRPQPNTPQQVMDPNSSTSYSQNELAELMKVSPRSLPKWLNDIILVELRPLFLRVRFLNEKNEILDDFISKMFPKFFESNQQWAIELAKHYRSTWSDWRHTLRKNIKERHSKKTFLDNWHISEIFQLWLAAIRGNLSAEVMSALRNVVTEEFHHISQNVKPFDQSKSDRFTINLSFSSRSGYDIASSLNLAYEEAASSSEEDQ